jgi:hypothetical protein
VLGLQTGLLLLIRTNLGYGTVLMVACAHQGCSASDYDDDDDDDNDNDDDDDKNKIFLAILGILKPVGLVGS